MTRPRDRILAIDDHPANLFTLGATLEGEYELQFATSGVAGIELALKEPPDLILLDVMMPEVDGFDTLQRLTAQPTLQNIPVIFITALHDAVSEEAGLNLGAADYITKPINVVIARQRIRNLLTREHLRKEVTRQAMSLRKLWTAMEHSPAAVAVTDLDARLEYVNPRFTEITGYSAQEVLGQNPRLLQSGLTPAATHLEMWTRLGQGLPWTGELINRRKNGEVFWEEAQVAPVKNEQGVVTSYVAVKIDISARRQAEQARQRVVRALQLLKDTNITLARAESKAQLLQDTCTVICESGGYRMAWVGYVQPGPDQRVVAMAHSGCDDASFENLQHAWSASSLSAGSPLGEAVQTAQPRLCRDYAARMEVPPAWRQAARSLGYQSSISLPFLKRSVVLGVLTIYSDAQEAFSPDEQTLLEELTLNMAHELDAMEERRKRFEAESASRAKAHFLANMSHEMRTPLNAIIGMSHLIRRGELAPMQSEKLGKLENASHHLLRLINDILDLSKIDADKLTLEQAPVAIQSVVSNVISMVSERAQSKQLKVVSEWAELPQNLKGDATRLQQALLNYVNNAVKFTFAGEVRIGIKVAQETAQSVLLRFEVTDTGIGIDPSEIERIFSEFEQAEDSTTRRYGGTGLGLSITRKLARLMDGEAGAHSVLGAGSTFWFTARLKKEGLPEQSVTAGSAVAALARVKEQHSGLRVLVAEDDPVNGEIARILLEDAGFEVDVAEDGALAVAAAGKTAYGLILMDMQMPTMDGLDATRHIRQLPGYAQTPILAATANAYAEDKERCFAAGMSHFISKPLLPDDLYATVLVALDRP